MNDGTSKRSSGSKESEKKYYKAGRGRYLKAVDDVSFLFFRRNAWDCRESGCGKTTCGKP